MNLARAARLSTYVLAVLICTFGAPIWAVAEGIALVGLSGPLEAIASNELPGLLWLYGLPLALTLAVMIRAILTQSPTDLSLAGLGVFCGSVSLLALFDYWDGGVGWSVLFTYLAGTLLAVAVLADAVVTLFVRWGHG
jgi:hypothetical protein